jgi:hypothetical protein
MLAHCLKSSSKIGAIGHNFKPPERNISVAMPAAEARRIWTNAATA